MARPWRPRAIRAALLACMAVCATATADAHHLASGGAVQGIPVASLTHREVAVVARHRAEIASLAERQIRSDLTLRRLLTYANVQRFACLWGLVPGSLADETSPFNECSHAFLSGYKALLARMAAMEDTPERARTLAAQIAREVESAGEGPALCAYSGEVFDTAEIIAPHWTDIPRHLVSLLTLLGTVLLAFGSVALVRRLAMTGVSAAAR